MPEKKLLSSQASRLVAGRSLFFYEGKDSNVHRGKEQLQ
jgi:hypothetical protein